MKPIAKEKNIRSLIRHLILEAVSLKNIDRLNFDNIESTFTNNDKIVIFVFGPKCQSSESLKSQILDLQSVHSDVKFVKVNSKQTKMITLLKVTKTPTTIIYKDDKQYKKVIGNKPQVIKNNISTISPKKKNVKKEKKDVEIDDIDTNILSSDDMEAYTIIANVIDDQGKMRMQYPDPTSVAGIDGSNLDIEGYASEKPFATQKDKMLAIANILTRIKTAEGMNVDDKVTPELLKKYGYYDMFQPKKSSSESTEAVEKAKQQIDYDLSGKSEKEINELLAQFMEDFDLKQSSKRTIYVSKTKKFLFGPISSKKFIDRMISGAENNDYKQFIDGVALQKYGVRQGENKKKRFQALLDAYMEAENRPVKTEEPKVEKVIDTDDSRTAEEPAGKDFSEIIELLPGLSEDIRRINEDVNDAYMESTVFEGEDPREMKSSLQLIEAVYDDDLKGLLQKYKTLIKDIDIDEVFDDAEIEDYGNLSLVSSQVFNMLVIREYLEVEGYREGIFKLSEGIVDLLDAFRRIENQLSDDRLDTDFKESIGSVVYTKSYTNNKGETINVFYEYDYEKESDTSEPKLRGVFMNKKDQNGVIVRDDKGKAVLTNDFSDYINNDNPDKNYDIQMDLESEDIEKVKRQIEGRKKASESGKILREKEGDQIIEYHFTLGKLDYVIGDDGEQIFVDEDTANNKIDKISELDDGGFKFDKHAVVREVLYDPEGNNPQGNARIPAGKTEYTYTRIKTVNGISVVQSMIAQKGRATDDNTKEILTKELKESDQVKYDQIVSVINDYFDNKYKDKVVKEDYTGYDLYDISEPQPAQPETESEEAEEAAELATVQESDIINVQFFPIDEEFADGHLEDIQSDEGKVLGATSLPGRRISPTKTAVKLATKTKLGRKLKARADEYLRGNEAIEIPFTDKHVGRNHTGVDVPTPVGSKVYAVTDGKATFTKTTGGGNTIILQAYKGDNPTNMYYRYKHLQLVASGINTNDGRMFKAGEQIGMSGNDGEATTGPHLHFSVSPEGKDSGNLELYQKTFKNAKFVN